MTLSVLYWFTEALDGVWGPTSCKREVSEPLFHKVGQRATNHCEEGKGEGGQKMRERGRRRKRRMGAGSKHMSQEKTEHEVSGLLQKYEVF